MDESKKNSIFLNGKSWYVFHALSLIFIVLIYGVLASPISNHIKTRISLPILFNSREIINKPQAITEKLKIFAIDDSTFSFLGGPRLSTEDLHLLLKNISDKKPKVILIDGLLSDRPADSDKQFLNMIRKEQMPVYTGAYPSSTDIPHRHLLKLNKSSYTLKHYGVLNKAQRPLLTSRKKWKIYGYESSYEGVFKGVGHLTYNNDGTVSPFYLINPKQVLPHISLYAANTVKFEDKHLKIDGFEVPVTKTGSVPINHRPPIEFYKKTKSLRHMVQRARQGIPEKNVQEGDVVLLIFGFATGNTDFHENSPFGEIPGALMIANMINDIVTGSWITKYEIEPWLILFFSILGIIVGINARPRMFWPALLLVCGLTQGLVCYLFAFHSIQIPWILPLLAFIGTSSIHFAHVLVQSEIKMVEVEKNYYRQRALRLEEQHEKAVLEENLELGRAVQKLLLPKEMGGNFKSFIYQMKYTPHLKMAGDWFFTWEVSKHERRILIGDVMGKGASAAIPVAVIIGILKDCQSDNIPLDKAVDILNQRLIDIFDYYITSTLSAITLYSGGKVELLNAGGTGWYKIENGALDVFLLRSNPLGMSKNFSPSKTTASIEPSSIFFTFTDGYAEGSREVKKLSKRFRKFSHFQKDISFIHSHLQTVKEEADDDKSLLTIYAA